MIEIIPRIYSKKVMIKFINERKKDEEDVENLLDLVFSPSRFHLSSYSLRLGVQKINSLCYVAKNETGMLLGVVRQWPVQIGDCFDNISLLTGPVAVHPTAQGEGLGSSLLNLSLSKSKEEGWKRALLIGDLNYYKSFGFRQQSTQRVIFPPPTDPRRVLFLELQIGSFKGLAGKVRRFT